MRIALLAATALGGALLLAAPAGAQMSGNPDAPRSAAPDDVLRHSRDQAAPAPMRPAGSAAVLGEAARRADAAVTGREPARLLDGAGRAVEAGNWALATELVERAQTTLLNEHVQTGGGGAVGGNPEALRSVGQAASAVNARDRARARSAIAAARNAAAQGSGIAQSSGSMAPGTTGQAPMGQGAMGTGAGGTKAMPGTGGAPAAAGPSSLGPGHGETMNSQGVSSPNPLPPGAPGTTPLLNPLGGAQQR
jgi:hypothetical protein